MEELPAGKKENDMTMTENKIKELRKMAVNVRADILEMISSGKVGHFGGSMSIADIMTALYFYCMRFNPKDLSDPERDRLILSKGHAALAQYACLAELGYFDRDELRKVKTLEGILQGHPDNKSTPGIEASTGSLGQGLSIALGMALALRLDNKMWRIYAICGDGELAEGQIWEAAMAASAYRVSNLTAIVDWNGVQATDATSNVLPLGDLPSKWKAFGWHVQEIDGHDMTAIVGAVEQTQQYDDGPSVILAHTIKGKGFPFAEGKAQFHNAALSEEQYRQALACIERMRVEAEHATC